MSTSAGKILRTCLRKCTRPGVAAIQPLAAVATPFCMPVTWQAETAQGISMAKSQHSCLLAARLSAALMDQQHFVQVRSACSVKRSTLR